VRLLSLLTSKAERISAGDKQAPRASGIPFGLMYRPKRDSLYGESLGDSQDRRERKKKEKEKKRKRKKKEKIPNTLSRRSRIQISRSTINNTITTE